MPRWAKGLCKTLSSMIEIRYRHALNQEGKLLTVKEAEQREIYICPSCRERLIFRAGEKNQKHFAHFKDACNYETYLHKTAKIALAQCFQKLNLVRIPYELQIFDLIHSYRIDSDDIISSEPSEKMSSYDILAERPDVNLEANYEGFVPDILLEGPTQAYFVEICVTHAVSEVKKNSGFPIIEIRIDNEDDILNVVKGSIVEGPKLQLYNFDGYRILHRRQVPTNRQELSRALHGSLNTNSDLPAKQNPTWVQFREKLYPSTVTYAYWKTPGEVYNLTKAPRTVVEGVAFRRNQSIPIKFSDEIQSIYESTLSGQLSVISIDKIT